MLVLEIRSKTELEEIALKRIRAWPGCRGDARVALTLDGDGEGSFEVSDAGSADAETFRRAAIAVLGTRCMMNLTWHRQLIQSLLVSLYCASQPSICKASRNSRHAKS
jgi:hypothetical protein